MNSKKRRSNQRFFFLMYDEIDERDELIDYYAHVNNELNLLAFQEYYL